MAVTAGVAVTVGALSGCMGRCHRRDARIQEYQDRCSKAALAEYSATAANDPSVNTVRRSPDQASWDIGDRSVTCIVEFDPPRAGSVRPQ